MSQVSRILSQVGAGESAAEEKLLSLIYDELRQLAAAKLAREKPGQTLQATALVHEAYLRLVGKRGGARDDAGSVGDATHTEDVRWHSRGHFFAAAAEAMRCISIPSRPPTLKMETSRKPSNGSKRP